MKLKTFLAFISPSVIAMITLIAIPLIGVVWLATTNSYVKTEIVEVESSVPLFGGMVQKKIEKVPKVVKDEQGNPIKVTEFVGFRNLVSVADPAGLWNALIKDRSVTNEGKPSTIFDRIKGMYKDVVDIDFWRALEFTLIYAFVTTPMILVLGFVVAVSINSMTQKIRGPLIFASLLPHIITPVVGSLSIYWLFLDNAVMAALLEQLGAGKVYFLKDAITIRSLIIFYGVWHVTPFAFVILYAGLQSVSKDTLGAAMIDGASFKQRIRYIVIPHLKPLFGFIFIIHIMDAYRIFEPILVFGSNLFANSLQYLTYYILFFEDNTHKAAASALLTVFGIILLLSPFMYRTFREQKGGY